jgi:hypothetical protein
MRTISACCLRDSLKLSVEVEVEVIGEHTGPVVIMTVERAGGEGSRGDCCGKGVEDELRVLMPLEKYAHLGGATASKPESNHGVRGRIKSLQEGLDLRLGKSLTISVELRQQRWLRLHEGRENLLEF